MAWGVFVLGGRRFREHFAERESGHDGEIGCTTWHSPRAMHYLYISIYTLGGIASEK
jgi:hypothetical protein